MRAASWASVATRVSSEGAAAAIALGRFGGQERWTLHEVVDVVTIRLRRNGPYVIESDEVTVIDWEGAQYPIDRRPIALCRCGASSKKPFCDGTHGKIGFDGGSEAKTPGVIS